jgi:ribosomal RNA-processing protein 12
MISDLFPYLTFQAFNASFAQLLSQILYNQPHLRPAILKALKVVVESNFWVASDVVTVSDANRNLEHLKSQAESWFAVLFNVFGTVGQDAKGMVGDVISVWAKIAGDEVNGYLTD